MERKAISLRSRITAGMILPLLSFALLAPMRLRAEELGQPGSLVRRWCNAHELLSALAERNGIRWAMPETLAGNALVGGENLSARQILDDACAQFGLTWTRAQDGIVVVHRADDAMTWTYDLDTNTWTEIANAGGPGNPWVGSMVFDPEHNVVLVMNFRARNI